MHVLKIILIVLEVVLLFNVLIFVHELGHFLAARWRGLKVERFAIWFGKPIWRARVNGIEYALGWIPAGGYVSLPQMAPMEMLEGKSEETAQPLPPVSARDKIIVAFAGPLFSFGLAVVFACVVSLLGRPVTEADSTTIVGFVEKDGPAYKAGVREGDRIVSVDGKPVTKFSGLGSSIMWRVVRSEGSTIPIEVERNGQVVRLESGFTKEKTKAWQRKGLRQILVGPAYTPIVGDVVTNSPAAAAGLRPGDEILQANGVRLYSNGSLGEYLENRSVGPVTLAGRRHGQPIEVTVTPKLAIDEGRQKPRLGIIWDQSGGRMTLNHPSVGDQIYASVDAMVSTFGALVSKKSDIKPQHLNGPIKIINIYYVLFSSEHGWRWALWFSVILNVNLALLNLLPLPVLDGGHIVLSVIEGVMRKPVSARVLQGVQTAFAVLLIGFMLYIAFFDVQDSSWRLKSKPASEMKFKAEPPGN